MHAHYDPLHLDRHVGLVDMTRYHELKNHPWSPFAETFLRYWYVPALILCMILLGRTFLTFVIITLMALSAIAVGLIRRFVPFALGLELVTLFSVILATALGAWAGITFALATITLIDAINGNLCGFIIVKYIVYALICAIASLGVSLAGVPLVALGIALVLLKNALFMGITLAGSPARFFRDLPSNVINSATNIFLFCATAPAIAHLIA